MRKWYLCLRVLELVELVDEVIWEHVLADIACAVDDVRDAVLLELVLVVCDVLSTYVEKLREDLAALLSERLYLRVRVHWFTVLFLVEGT